MLVLLCLALVASAVATVDEETYQCHSDYNFGPVAAATQKGLAMDDTSYRWCSESIPTTWPNAEEAVTSIRLFKAWDASWQDDRQLAYDNLKNFVTRNGAKVLMGTSITCSAEADAQEWSWAKELLTLLGPDHVMGLSIGNEVELFFTKSKSQVPQSCVDELWDGGQFWSRFTAIVEEFDALGFGEVPVTSVFGGLALAGDDDAGHIFYEQPNKALVNSFFLNATQRYADRYAWTWNLYPYFDPAETLDEGTEDSCEVARAKSLCWDTSCDAPKSLAYYRKRMTELTGRSDDIMWIGETGWSSDGSTNTEMKNCKNWASKDSLMRYYENFLLWDLSVEGQKPPDHAFYFSIRDALNYGNDEHFGIIEQCFMTACKLHSEDFEAPPAQVPTHPGCYYQQPTTGNGQCDGPWKFWKLDEFGMYDPEVMSSESEANCMARKSGHDGYCGTDTQWLFVPKVTSNTTTAEATTTTTTARDATTVTTTTTTTTVAATESSTTSEGTSAVSTTGTTGQAGTTTEEAASVVTIDTELEMPDVSEFDIISFARALANLSDIPSEDVVIEKVEFHVTVRYSFEGVVSQAEAREAIALIAGVPLADVRVVVSVTRRLQAQDFAAIITSREASSVAEIEAGLNDSAKVSDAMEELGLNVSATLAAKPTTSVLVTTNLKTVAPDSNQLSLQLADAWGTDVSATVLVVTTTTTTSTTTEADSDAEDNDDQDASESYTCAPPMVLELFSAVLLLFSF